MLHFAEKCFTPHFINKAKHHIDAPKHMFTKRNREEGKEDIKSQLGKQQHKPSLEIGFRPTLYIKQQPNRIHGQTIQEDEVTLIQCRS